MDNLERKIWTAYIENLENRIKELEEKEASFLN